ncbi:MAG: helix-turn-helix transcriptional regulator [Polaromonas sp.]|uniref:helix-turn-helix domain-containing protein n=1 Tax=Polaromonas sp. TaxID=1869339 RepID=UPI002730BEF6|nr:helix-turn-helix transcriptional regulator [Polaromonas sp.]MDP1742421.1 helix-turn-helix transcriptional regulator [Polaromonas sp.]MDP1955038.1 helix-turn-helix transcriptional regulator [Polaromonas sp.]MDP3355337.1 helix-turn-helix transcriptional regulator [Polaromonas sp.]MDP3750242.1 helix-turn-helix transcriptional regulator [Polaromonas sp.]
MPNIATVLKAEISRVARKDTRAETQPLKKASAQYRSDIAALKRRVLALEKQLSRLARSGKAASSDTTEKTGKIGLRYSAKGLVAQRKRLGLTATAVAKILNVSVQSIYKWEEGKTRPRASQLPAIASLRKMGKQEAAKRLAELPG